ncbi:MAG: hypothetical protein KAH22_09685 [Thiotrichaceae bacterium]|nr:hypothetical protein [Thiotrichaceae bacterium]
MSHRKRSRKKENPIDGAFKILQKHPLMRQLLILVNLSRSDSLPAHCWAQIYDTERTQYSCSVNVILNIQHKLSVQEWVYILSIIYLHIALNHLQNKKHPIEWQTACEIYVLSFIKKIGIGKRPAKFMIPPFESLPIRDEHSLMSYFIDNDNVNRYRQYGLGTWKLSSDDTFTEKAEAERSRAFALGLQKAVQAAVNQSSNHMASQSTVSEVLKQANHWIISSFPLLSALASNFTLIEDQDVCERMQIDIAAINPELQEVYLNPRWDFDKQELIFILLHEYLHVGLRHDIREQGRNAYLWNIACDYVINGWLIEMDVGKIPALGLLHDPQLKGRSAEDIYDEITRNLRWQRKLAKAKTPRGNQKSDIINDKLPSWWLKGKGIPLDEFYRRSLKEGLEYCQVQNRGLFPAGLIEEIKAINQRPIPWDVALTKWLDQYFPPIERQRSYARLSRRQSATPDIPRPSWVKPEILTKNRTFGVILDTSGSMSRRELAMALGAISSYAGSRDVTHIRLIYCDATPYDVGYIEAESLLERIKVKGRGGTVLQPAVKLLQESEDFPTKGPLLIITDGGIDHLRIGMEHAYLLPKGMRLPYKTKAPVFYFE